MTIHKDTLEKARKVTVFMYRHGCSTSELMRSDVIRFAAKCLTLKCILELRVRLKFTFIRRSGRPLPIREKRCSRYGSAQFLLTRTSGCVKRMISLVKVTSLVDSDVKLTMGYTHTHIYTHRHTHIHTKTHEAINRGKEANQG